MKRISINVEGLGHGDLPIPSASRIGPFLATGGISGLNRLTHRLAEQPEDQVQLMFENLIAVLEAGGAAPENILKMTIWVKDITLRPSVNTWWLKWFPDAASRPARHILIYDLPGALVIQCEALAVCPSTKETHAL